MKKMFEKEKDNPQVVVMVADGGVGRGRRWCGSPE
jgi:hypothetical protein